MLQQAGNSSFAEKNKAFGILQKEILYDWILPHLIKKLKGEHLLVLDFTKEEVDLFADDFATYEINQFLKKRVLSGEKVTKEQYDALLEHQKSNTTTRRTMKIPAGYYDNIRTKVDIITTGENQDKAAMMESLNTLLITVAQNPQVISDPALSKLFGKIIDLSGIGVSLPELAANVNQNVDPNQQSIPGQADASGVEGVQPGGLG
jgi:hypothetical protein